MGGFTNNELDQINLGKHYKYPNTTTIEEKAMSIVPSDETFKKKINSHNISGYDTDLIIKFTISILFLMGVFMIILAYFKANNMSIGNLFKDLHIKLRMSRGPLVSTKTIIMPKKI